MRKLLAYFKMVLADALIYRAEGIIWMLNDIGPALVALLFWSAAFQTQSVFAGYSYSQMLVYYLGVMVVNNVINTQPQYFLSEEIRNGEFVNYLLKPIGLTRFKLASNTSWRLVRLVFFLPLIILIAVIFGFDFSAAPLSLPGLVLLFISLTLSFLINFFLKLALGLTTIWLEEAGWLFFSFEIISTFFSGELIPLDFFPAGLAAVNNFLPFKYLLYYPLSVALGRLSRPELIAGLIGQLVWALLAYLIYRLIFRRGRRAYSAYGG